MDANHAARADAGSARFSSKARRVGAVIDRKLTFGENFLAMNVGDGRFGSLE